MEQKKRKRILYSICFIGLILIDWVRGSQVGVRWMTAINLTGAFVSVVAMSRFSWKKEPRKHYLCWLGIWLMGSLVGFGIWRTNPGEIFLSQYLAGAFSVGTLGIAAIRIWRENRNTKDKKLGNHLLLACWVVMSVLMSASRMGELWPAWYLVVFLLFYMTDFSEKERRNLWDGLADALIISFFILQVFAYGFRPYDELRYKGAYGNCNMNALFYMVTYLALLYRIHSLKWQELREGVTVTRKRKLAKGSLWVLAAGIWGFLFLTMTRTALLAIVAITIIYGVLEFRVIWGEKFSKILVRGAVFLLGIVLTFPMVYLTVRYLPTILHHPVWFDGEYTPEKIHSYEPWNSEKYVSPEELFEGLLNRLDAGKEEGISQSLAPAQEFPLLAAAEVTAEMLQQPEEYLLTGEAAKSSMRIRLEIFKLYLKNMNLTGHELEEGYFQITEDYHAWHAQNVFLQVGFYYGIIAGILFVVLMAGLGIQSLRLVMKKRSCEDLLPILVWLLFVGYGMLECVWYPGQTILLLIYLVPKILIDGRNERKEIICDR